MHSETPPLVRSAENQSTSFSRSGLSDQSHGRLSLLTKVLYGIGATGDSIKSLSFGLFLLFFYTSVRGLPGSLVGVATAVGLIWDALVDPIIGRISDRLPARFGRRHTPMLIGSLGMGVAFFAIFSPPSGLQATSLLIWLVFFNLLLRTAQSAFTVPYWALGAELTDNYDERTELTGIRTACALASTMLAAVLSFVLFFSGSRFDPAGYRNMGAALGIFMTSCALLTTIGTLKHRERLTSGEAAASKVGRFRKDLSSAFSDRSFVILTVSGALFFLSAILNATIAVHYLTYFADLTENKAASIFQAAFYGAALAGVFLWMKATRVVEKRTVYGGATFGISIMLALSYVLVGEGRLLGAGNLIALAFGNGLAGLCASAAWVLPPSMLADVLDEHEVRTGMRSEGTFFGLYSLAIQIAGSIAIALSGVLLDHFAGLVPAVTRQSATTVDRIGILYGLLPAILLAVSAAIVFRYSLGRARVAEVQLELSDRRNHAFRKSLTPTVP